MLEMLKFHSNFSRKVFDLPLREMRQELRGIIRGLCLKDKYNGWVKTAGFFRVVIFASLVVLFYRYFLILRCI